MYIIIVGAGEVGNYLARILVEERHEVAIIEQDEKLARDLEASLDALVIAGSGVSREALMRAGIERADLVLAVTQIDEVNLIACMTAEKFGQNVRSVARVREARYLMGYSSLTARDLGVDLLISPEQAVASRVVDLLQYEGSGEVGYIANDQIAVLELPLSENSPLCHEPLASLRADLPSPSLVAAVRGADGLRIPKGDDVLKADERAFILTTPENIDEFLIMSGKPWHHVRHVLIVGCGTIGLHLAKQLEGQRLYPTIIEKDPDQAERVAKALHKSIVLRGDGTNPEMLREQLEEEADAVVVLIEDDEKALLTGLFARHLGAKKVVVRCEKLDYAPIGFKMGVDALISPRRAVADAILRYVRRGMIASTYMLGDHEGEIIDFTVPEKPAREEILHRPIREIPFPEGSLLGAIVRKGKVEIPTGETILQPGDELLVVTLPQSVRSLEKLFG